MRPNPTSSFVRTEIGMPATSRARGRLPALRRKPTPLGTVLGLRT